MSYVSDHEERAFDRIISQYQFDVVAGRNPMTLDPTGAFATRRLDGCKSDYVMRLHRDSDDVLIDVYDFRNGYSEYRETKDGDWIDMTADTYLLDTWYNQNIVGNDFSQSTKSKKPEVVPNVRNGWPALLFDGATKEIETAVETNSFIKPEVGVMMAGYRPEGTPPSFGIPNPCLGQPVLTDGYAYACMTRGIFTPFGPEDSIFVDLYYTTEVAVQMPVTASDWYDATWKLYSDVLYGFLNGSLVGSIGAGTITNPLDQEFRMGKHPYTSAWLNGYVDQAYTFDKEVSADDIADVSIFMRTE